MKERLERLSARLYQAYETPAGLQFLGLCQKVESMMPDLGFESYGSTHVSRIEYLSESVDKIETESGHVCYVSQGSYIVGERMEIIEVRLRKTLDILVSSMFSEDLTTRHILRRWEQDHVGENPRSNLELTLNKPETYRTNK